MTVLLIDNYDSFTHNLADGLRRAGAKVDVIRNDQITRDEVVARNPDAIVLSPGPGHPGNERDFGVCASLIRDPVEIPMLGICLGMQGMALHTGGQVGPAPTLVHGEGDLVELGPHPMFAGLAQPSQVARYHSLCVTHLGADWEPLGASTDGTLMAMRHTSRPWVGLQFHPESILTPDGETMIAQFLQTCL